MSASGFGVPERDPASFPEGAWAVPLELVLAAPSSSQMKRLVRTRMSRQDWPLPTAFVFCRNKRFFAEIRFHGDNRPAVFIPLDVFAAENWLSDGHGSHVS